MSDQPKFNIYTAIDIMDEKCVRLFQGDFDTSKTYNNDPKFVAKRWQSLGAKFLHIIDLDGARLGRTVNIDLIKSIIVEVEIPIQVGGGIRNIDTIERLIRAGAERVILGSAVIKDPELVQEALKKYGGDKIVLGLDTKNGYLAVEGWQEASQIKASDVIQDYKQHGLEIIHYTDIEKDGTLEGPNIEKLTARLENFQGVRTIISGGMGDIEDVRDIRILQNNGLAIDGVIVGKALYDGKIKPDQLYSDELLY